MTPWQLITWQWNARLWHTLMNNCVNNNLFSALIAYGFFTVAGSWNFLSYFSVVSQLFLTHFLKIFQLCLSPFPFFSYIPSYFPSISHFSLVSHLFLNYFLISHLFLNYFLVISQLCFDCSCIFKPFAILFLLVCFHMVSKYVN